MTSDTLPVEFRAGERWSGPLTWGQLAIWEVVRWLPPGDASLNLLRGCDVSPGRTTGDVADALRRLVERHEVLRTRFTRPENPEPRQTVEPHGRLDVAVVETDGRARENVVDELGSRLRSRPFDQPAELPLRAAVVTTGGAPVAVVLVFDHMAVDGYSVEIVGRDLRLLLADGGELPPRALQPRGRVAYEASDAARRRARQALEYWADGIRELPAALLVPDPGPERRQWARITSGALRLALRELADRHRMSLSMLVQALTGLLLGFYLDESRVGIRLIVATRFTAETRDYVGAFNQNGLLRLDLGAEPLAGFLGRARVASMRAYQYCECDPLLLEERIDAICAERGFEAGAYCFINDVRPFDEVRAEGGVGGDGESGPDLLGRIEAARRRTSVVTLDRDGRQKGAKFFLFLNTLVGEARLTLAADGRFLAPGSAQTFLADLEWLAIEAVSGDRTLPELAAAWRQRQR